MFSYQLYSSRNFPPLDQTLRMLAEAGYGAVEGYGALYADDAAVTLLAEGLSKHGLLMPTGHFGLQMLEQEVEKTLSIARRLKMDRIYCPYLMPDDRPKDAAGWRAFGARLDRAGAPYRDAGFGFGWHNHDFEFKPLPGGIIPQDEIFAGGPNLEWEMDVAWVVRGGADPKTWINRYGPRITAVHVKDIAPSGENADEDGWADVGTGIVDWAGLMPILKARGVRHFIMEHDNPKDHARFASRSIAAAGGF